MTQQSKLLEQAALHKPILDLYNQLPDILFWVKDTEHKAVWVNKTVSYYVNLNQSEIVGKTDMEIYPVELANNFKLDDDYVIQSGKGIIGKIELLVNRFGQVEWRKMTKLPILTEDGVVLGTTVVSIPYSNADESLPGEYEAFSHLIEYARNNLSDRIGVRELAQFAGMSDTTLNRRFQTYLQLTPQQLLTHLRISKACQLLEDSILNISEIADRCGYDSPAAFSRAFKTLKHTSPRVYRQNTQKGCSE